MNAFIALILFCLFLAAPAFAGCAVDDRVCIIDSLRSAAEEIEQQSWRDQTYRELAKTLAAEGRYDEAIAVIDSIANPDTQAMSIRGIGMAAAEHHASVPAYTALFKKLRTRAERIDHPPSHAIALTYIAMAQAFAGDDQGAWATAADMDNDALRHKAYGETAEIQAEQDKFDEAMTSIDFIESEAYRNKAYSITSKIFADGGHLAHALRAAEHITNPYKRASALQYVLDAQKPRELPHD